MRIVRIGLALAACTLAVSTLGPGLAAVAHDSDLRSERASESVAQREPGQATEAGHVGSYPSGSSASTTGAWRAHRYFPGGIVVVSGIE
ncbi:hypothetical protein [Micromonospora sp. WMMD1082]|uniref:hypothetical protein n=1 Tax=Micromonospora sp. WMMD1082 TaxID=3016104 RepID=UPI002415B169|nr:hypothetical protein [Micromonospora sp. WMMD1082]MDG4796364.1 hypothetical protein [Micromonospora sp. WMMD1082]